MFIKDLLEEKAIEALSDVYHRLHRLLCTHSTLMRNFPGRGDKHIEDLYRSRIKEVKTIADASFWFSKGVREKVYQITDEVDSILWSYSVPGVPERWYEINPKIKYFDYVFNIIEEDFEGYKRIKEEHGAKFKFIPTLDEYLERKAYIEKHENICMSEEFLLEDRYGFELCETLAAVFRHDFKDMLNIIELEFANAKKEETDENICDE